MTAKWIACLVLAAGCQRGTAEGQPATGAPAAAELPRAAVTPAYIQDITNLCDVLHKSGADQLPAGDRAPSIAMWLGPNIKTGEGHDFLVAIQPLLGAAKAEALDAEAQRVGLASCALAAEWRK